jgi:subtilisin family serine protease
MTTRKPRPRLVALSGFMLALWLTLLAAATVAAQTAPSAPRHAPDTILVRFKATAPPSERAQAHALAGASVHRSFTLVEGLQVVRVPRGMTVKDAIERYQRHPAVLYAEPNWIVRHQASPNDPGFAEMWGLNNTGQGGGAPDADIDAVEAWNLTTGSAGVVVAVIDSGIDWTHPDLTANLFRNTPDCNSNGVDDDGNGQIDDCFGINTAANTSNPLDDNNHGTHVAGTIGAAGNNGTGVVGVNWTVRIMACKFLAASGSGSVADAIDCLEYVKLMKDRGVDIVATNNSWGGGGFSQALFDAIDAHLERGILFIAAAGNNNSDNDATPFYPAGYYLPNVIAVAATTRFDDRASFSNFGRQTVALGAPGDTILSTTPNNTYSFFSGTSMATPHVTGVAALLKAQDPSRDWRAIKNLILAGGDTIPALAGTVTQKRLNARGALSCANATVFSRLLPVGASITGAVGTPVDLAALNINCASPNGNVVVTVEPGGQIVTLVDDGLGADRAAGDGIYSGRWVPTAVGTYSITFPGGDQITAQVLGDYQVSQTASSYRTISGVNLNLDEDAVVFVGAPFLIPFGGGRFSGVFVSPNGNASFTGGFTTSANVALPILQIPTLVAPWWDDLFPVAGTAQNVFWDVLGSAPNRELVIEWRDVRVSACQASATATIKFQIVFFESNDNVLFNYADTSVGGACASSDRGGSATVGLQVSTQSAAQFSLNTQSLSDGLSLLWSTLPPTRISVTPTSRNFGTVALGSSEDRIFTVQNLGTGVLSGTATTSAPFSIVSGGTYSLAAGQSQRVTVRFTPVAAGTASGSVAYTGGGGRSRALVGTGLAVSPAAAPAALAATPVSIGQINLTWQDTNGNETQSRIERKTGTGGTFAQIATPAANALAFSDTGLSPNTAYVYRVRACNAVGCSPYSNEATATTPGLPVALNLTVRGSAAGAVTSNPAGLSCTASCSASFAQGTVVTLTAAPGARARFKSWGGACSGATATCTVTLSDVRSVTATFSMSFTDATAGDTLPPGTPIKAAHFTELLDAINAVQPGANLSWPSPAPAVGGAVQAIHLQTLRQPLSLAPVSAGAVISAQHINDIRLKIRSLE